MYCLLPLLAGRAWEPGRELGTSSGIVINYRTGHGHRHKSGTVDEPQCAIPTIQLRYISYLRHLLPVNLLCGETVLDASWMLAVDPCGRT